MATTFTLVDTTYSKTSSTNHYIAPTTLYTVPSGKIAKVRFEGLYVLTPSNRMNTFAFTLFKQSQSNSSMYERYGSFRYQQTATGAFSVAFYAPWEKTHDLHNGFSSTSSFLMSGGSAELENWLSSGVPNTTPGDAWRGFVTSSSATGDGAHCMVNKDFYLKAGDVLKGNGVCTLDSSSTLYYTPKFAIWLEDA